MIFINSANKKIDNIPKQNLCAHHLSYFQTNAFQVQIFLRSRLFPYGVATHDSSFGSDANKVQILVNSSDVAVS